MPQKRTSNLIGDIYKSFFRPKVKITVSDEVFTTNPDAVKGKSKPFPVKPPAKKAPKNWKPTGPTSNGIGVGY